jgi:ComF family protein
MRFLKNIFYLFYPNICASCDNQLIDYEDVLCLSCRYDLPLTNFINITPNAIEQAFQGRVSIEFATSLLFYERAGVVHNLIHKLKYKGHQEIGVFLGNWLGNELLQCERLPKLDYIVPVPIHKNRLKKRGFNQVTKFGEQISKILTIPMSDVVLLRKLDSGTQTLKQRIDRFKDLKEKFYITDNDLFKGKHILLIDDVITTGATVEACIIKLQQIKDIKISIATMAFTA